MLTAEYNTRANLISLVFVAAFLAAGGAAWWRAPAGAGAGAALRLQPPAARRCPDPGITVTWNGRRYAAAVVGVPDYKDDGRNATRDVLFAASWAAAWPALGVRRQAAFLNSKELRGLGNMVGHYLAIQHALSNYDDSFDYIILFEDDAIPHANTTWPGAGGPNDLDAHLDSLERSNGSVLFLGGHTIRGYSPEAVAGARASPRGGAVAAAAGYGSYAYVLPRAAAAAAAEHLRGRLRNATANKPKGTAVDDVLWALFAAARPAGPAGAGAAAGGGGGGGGGGAAAGAGGGGGGGGGAAAGGGGGAFVSTPLLVDHRPGSSETWRGIKDVQRPFQGSREWWAFTRP